MARQCRDAPPVLSTNLSGYTATQVGSTAVFNWSGQALNIPASAGPLYVSVRAANGTGYATMPNYIKVGLIFDWQGEGVIGAMVSGQTGQSTYPFIGLFGYDAFNFTGNSNSDVGPRVTGNWVPSQTVTWAGDRFSIQWLRIPDLGGCRSLRTRPHECLRRLAGDGPEQHPRRSRDGDLHPWQYGADPERWCR